MFNEFLRSAYGCPNYSPTLRVLDKMMFLHEQIREGFIEAIEKEEVNYQTWIWSTRRHTEQR